MTAIIRQKNSRATCRGGSGREICDELRLGLALSVASMATALAMVVMGVTGTSTPHFVGFLAGIFVLVAWSVCVAYLTFDNGPASSVGNLFFGTWISFLLALYLAMSQLLMFGASIDSGSSSNDARAKETATKKKGKASKTEAKKESASETP